MANSKAACSDCGATFAVAFEPVAGRPLYCSECFFRNFGFKTRFKSNYYFEYLSDFIAFLSMKSPAFMKGNDVPVEREGFLYQVLLKESGTPRFVCTIELIPAAEPRATAKFIVIISAKGSKVQNIKAYIDEFQRSHGMETEIPLTPLRRF